MKYANDALELAKKIGFEKGRGNALMVIGNCYDYEGNEASALKYYQDCLDVFTKISYKVGIARSHGNLGIIFEKMGNYPKALEGYFNALSTFKDLRDSEGIATCYNNIGNVNIRLNDFDKALDNYLQALNINKKIGDASGYSDCLQNIANIYHHNKDYGKALENYSEALKITRTIGDQQSEASVLGNIANIYNDEKEYDSAFFYDSKALALSKSIGDVSDYGFDLSNMGYIYLYQKKFNESKVYFDSALQISKQTGDKEYIKDIYRNLANIDSANGDFKTAWTDYKNYIIYRDSLLNEATIKKTTQAEMKYEQDKLNAVAEKERQRQKVIRNAFIGGFSIMFLAAGLFFFQRKRIAKEKKRSDELLLNILPEEVAEELKQKGNADAKSFDEVTVMFTDFKGFTNIAEKLSAKELVAEIDYCFKGFDNIIHKYNIEKIKTIGDSYMAAGGLPMANKTHAKDVVNAALEIVGFMEKHKQQRIKEGKPVFEIRIGINTGHVVAGIVGVKKFAYDIWGDTVNLASRMESSGEPGKINISGSTYELVKDDFNCTHRGKIQAKNKGEVDMYFVEGKV